MKVKNFEVSNDQKLSFNWAIKFQELFLKNLKNKAAPLKKIKKVGYEDFVEPIREIIEETELPKHIYNWLMSCYKKMNSGTGLFWIPINFGKK